MSTKYLDENGLLYFWGKIKSYVANHCGVTDVKYDASTKKIQQSKNGGLYEDVVSVATIKTDLALTKSDVGLGNVDNTSDANKPISTATQTALDAKAPLASPALTGNPTAPTQSTSDDSTKLATTEFVHDVIDGLSTGVTGVKGNAESTYRTGQVNLTPANLGITDFPGATASADGDHGLVPKPETGEQNKVLFGDGDWDTLTLNQGYDSSSRTIELTKGVSPDTTAIGSVTIPQVGTAAGLMSTTDKAKLDAMSGGSVWYGTSSTSASTAAKVVTCNGFTIKAGSIIAVLFSQSNTAATPTLNVNSTGAKSIHVGNVVPNATTNVLKWSANTLIFFMYDGSVYKYLGSVANGSVVQPRGANTWYGSCSTGATTAAKTATIDNFVLTKGAVAVLQMETANTNTGALTLNVNSTGAKEIVVGRTITSSNNSFTWSAGDVLVFVYDGVWWRLAADDTIYSDFVGASGTDYTDPANPDPGDPGQAGLVPAPIAGSERYVLFGDGDFHGIWLEWGSSDRTVKLRINDGTNDVTIGGCQIPIASGWTYGLVTGNTLSSLANQNAFGVIYLNDDESTHTAVSPTDQLTLNGTAGIQVLWDSTYHMVNIGHTNSVTAGTIGSSSASSGRTIAIPYASYDANGHIIAQGTHTHTIGSLQASDVTSGTFDIARIPITGSVADGNTGLVTGDTVYDAIQGAISGITGISFDSSYSSVSDLPATGTAGVIYLIPNSGSNPNSYDEYVWVGSSYEKLGTTDVDLTGYLNTTNHIAITNAEIDTICV